MEELHNNKFYIILTKFGCHRNTRNRANNPNATIQAKKTYKFGKEYPTESFIPQLPLWQRTCNIINHSTSAL